MFCVFICVYYLLIWANISAKLLAFSFHLKLEVFLYRQMYIAVSKM